MTPDLAALARAEWVEAQHPRGKGGRFVHGVGAGAAGKDWGEDYAPLPADRWVPDLAPAEGVKALTSRGRPDGAGTPGDPVDVEGNLNRALSLMRRGKHVRLNQPDEVALLLDRVVDLSRRAERKGQRPTWDFGLLSVVGTNLFAAQHRGIPRIGMPQFSGLAQPDSEAARLAGGAGKFIDLGPEFAARLRREGVAVRRKRVLVSHLRATQTELDGSKVAGFADAVRHGNPKARKALAEPIFVTRDHYVIDGHHRWAGNLMLDSLDGTLGNDTWQSVTEIDLDIGAAIPYALAFAQDMGIANRALARSRGLDWDPAEYMLLPPLARTGQPRWDPREHPRDREGKFAQIGNVGIAALDPYYNEIPETRGTGRGKGVFTGPTGRDLADQAKLGDGVRKIAEPITAAEARDASRAVSEREYQDLAREGLNQLGQMAFRRSPCDGLDERWDQVKAAAWAETRKPWGGATIDSHTGEPLDGHADRYALSVKPKALRTVSVPDTADRAEFERAMDEARERFRRELEKSGHYLGVFHDDEQRRIDIDPVVVVDTPHEVEAIGAYTHAIGGAYHFATGNGVFPPHVVEGAA